MLNFLQLFISDVIDFVPSGSPNVSTNFGDDRSNNKEWKPFFEIQNGGGRHLEIWLPRFFDVTDVVKIKVLNIPTKCGYDWSNSKEMATVFRNSRWRQYGYLD